MALISQFLTLFWETVWSESWTWTKCSSWLVELVESVNHGLLVHSSVVRDFKSNFFSYHVGLTITFINQNVKQVMKVESLNRLLKNIWIILYWDWELLLLKFVILTTLKTHKTLKLLSKRKMLKIITCSKKSHLFHLSKMVKWSRYFHKKCHLPKLTNITSQP